MHRTLIFLIIFLFFYSPVYSVPLHPDLVKKINLGIVEGPNLKAIEEAGINNPPATSSIVSYLNIKRALMKNAGYGAPVMGDFKMLAILVKFSDKPNIKNPEFFDNLVFGEGSTDAPTVRNYYSEMSSGQLNITTVNLPSSMGWLTAPQTYAYYVGSDQGASMSRYLVGELVAMIDPVVDFSQYDNDNDGHVDGIIVIHAGTGYEYAGGVNIWSHMSSIIPQTRDGKIIDIYSIQPEYWTTSKDMTIGVMSHETGHLFGLPDLYDYGYDSAGVGNWSIMASGSWNGNMGSHPAGFDAWCRKELGFNDPLVLSADLIGASIPDVKDGGEIYRINTEHSNEFFLVENRQKTGYDQYIPGSGLLIWHIDESMSNNDNQNHYRVALEQADGDFDLEYDRNQGDSGDPFHSEAGKAAFGQGTEPDSSMYGGSNSGFAIANISESAQTMLADIYVNEPFDSTAPVRDNGAPLGTQSAGTTEVTVSLTTDDNAVCRYSQEPLIEYFSMTEKFEITGQTAHSFEVFGLSNGDSGKYYVRCMNIQGFENTNDYVIEFDVEETPEDTVKPAAVNDLTVVECDRDTCQLSWTSTGDDGSNGTAFQYDIRYSIEKITPENWSSASQVESEPLPLVAGSDQEIFIDGLVKMTKYYFGLRVSDEFLNWSDLSNIPEGETTNEEKSSLSQIDGDGITVSGGCGFLESESNGGNCLILMLLGLILFQGIHLSFPQS